MVFQVHLEGEKVWNKIVFGKVWNDKVMNYFRTNSSETDILNLTVTNINILAQKSSHFELFTAFDLANIKQNINFNDKKDFDWTVF